MIGVYGRSLWLVVAMCALQAVMAAIGVGYALMMRGAIDAAVAGDRNGFIREAAVFAVAIAVQIAVRAVSVVTGEQARSAMDNRMRGRVFAGVLGSPIARSQRYHSGELMNRLTSDVSVVDGAVTSLLPSIASMAIRVVGVVSVMVVLAPTLTVLLLAGGALMVTLSLPLRGLLKRLHLRVQEAEGRARSFMLESLEGLLVIQSFGVARKVARQAGERLASHRRARIRRASVTAFASTGLASAVNLGYLIGFVWSGFGILHGTISYGTMMAVIQLIGQIQSPFAMIGGMFPRHTAMLASAERLMDLMPEEHGKGSASAAAGTAGAAGAGAGVADRPSAAAVYARMRALRFDDVDFTYGRNAVLRSFSADVRRGDFVAITGRSGIGKSTVLKLLLGAYAPQRGRIGVVLDAAGGESSRERLLSVGDVPRGFFAYVPQGNALMSGTIREVVAFGDPDPDPAHIDDDRVREACRIAEASEFIEQLPDGYGTQLGERGSGLSEGQMQRIAVARALYSQAPVLLLDESTSALDERTEHAMLQRIRALHDRTVLIVTHRPEVLAFCDATIALGSASGSGSGGTSGGTSGSTQSDAPDDASSDAMDETPSE